MRFIALRLTGKVATVSNITNSNTVLHGTSNTFVPFQVDGTNLATFVFLYGTIPTAPSVLIYGSRYRLCENIVIVFIATIIVISE